MPWRIPPALIDNPNATLLGPLVTNCRQQFGNALKCLHVFVLEIFFKTSVCPRSLRRNSNISPSSIRVIKIEAETVPGTLFRLQIDAHKFVRHNRIALFTSSASSSEGSR